MSATYNICLLPGDGIGPEIMDQAKKILDVVSQCYDVRFNMEEQLLGGIAIDKCNTAFPAATLEAARAADAVLLAAVGGPKWDTTDADAPRPEQGLLGIRKELGLYANVRPVRGHASLGDASTLKQQVIEGVDLVIVRELTGGLYFGRRERMYDQPDCGVGGALGQRAFDTMDYREFEVDRIARTAFDMARRRNCRVCSVDKANVLESSRMWREVVHNVAQDYPDVQLSDMLVDNAAMQLIRDPRQFDVIVTENTFGDILSDEAAQLTGSLGMLASASLGAGTGLFEPTHGSAPDIAGRDEANPLAQILSVALMLQYSLHMPEAAAAIETAVDSVLENGWRTCDLADEGTSDDRIVGCARMGDIIACALRDEN